MYGYYRSGRKIMGIREILLVHLMKDEQNSYCNVPKRLTITGFGMGKYVCKGCKIEKKRLEKIERKKVLAEQLAFKLADDIKFTASMF